LPVGESPVSTANSSMSALVIEMGASFSIIFQATGLGRPLPALPVPRLGRIERQETI
jgi:hypothetical protein